MSLNCDQQLIAKFSIYVYRKAGKRTEPGKTSPPMKTTRNAPTSDQINVGLAYLMAMLALGYTAIHYIG